MADNTKTLRRHMIRLTLVTGSTVATIIGAQSLATIDEHSFQADIASANPVIQATALMNTQPSQMAMSTPPAISLIIADDTPTRTAEPTLVQVVPRITILRGAADTPNTGQNPVANPVMQIAPPSPVEIAPPPPIIIQNTPQMIIQEVPAPAPAQAPSQASGPERSVASNQPPAPAPRTSSS